MPRKLSQCRSGADFCGYLDRTPAEPVHQNGSHRKYRRVHDGKVHTLIVPYHHHDLGPRLRRVIVKGIAAAGLCCLVIAFAALGV